MWKLLFYYVFAYKLFQKSHMHHRGLALRYNYVFYLHSVSTCVHIHFITAKRECNVHVPDGYSAIALSSTKIHGV